MILKILRASPKAMSNFEQIYVIEHNQTRIEIL